MCPIHSIDALITIRWSMGWRTLISANALANELVSLRYFYISSIYAPSLQLNRSRHRLQFSVRRHQGNLFDLEVTLQKRSVMKFLLFQHKSIICKGQGAGYWWCTCSVDCSWRSTYKCIWNALSRIFFVQLAHNMPHCCIAGIDFRIVGHFSKTYETCSFQNHSTHEILGKRVT